MRSVEDESVFILTDNNLTEADESEFFEPGTEVRVGKMIDEQGNMFLGAVESINADTEHRSITG